MIMFSRGIRGISIDNNISAVVFKPGGDISPSELARQLLYYTDTDPSLLISTPGGELIISADKDPGSYVNGTNGLCIDNIAKISVSGVCMSDTGAKIYKALNDNDIKVLFTSTCDIAASFLIDVCNTKKAVEVIRQGFTLEV